MEENNNKNIGNLSEVIFVDDIDLSYIQHNRLFVKTITFFHFIPLIETSKKLKHGVCVSGSMQEMTKLVMGLSNL